MSRHNFSKHLPTFLSSLLPSCFLPPPGTRPPAQGCRERPVFIADGLRREQSWPEDPVSSQRSLFPFGVEAQSSLWHQLKWLRDASLKTRPTALGGWRGGGRRGRGRLSSLPTPTGALPGLGGRTPWGLRAGLVGAAVLAQASGVGVSVSSGCCNKTP